jgi:hypothetical protein
LLAVLAACLPAAGAPSVSGVSGDISQRAALSVSGTAFGPAPDVILFDDFENGTDGGAILTGPGSAVVGQWNRAGGTPYYTDSYSVSGSISFQANMATTWVEYMECLLPEGTMDVFSSWWLYIPAGDRIPGEGTTDGTNWKTVWLQGSGTADDDQTLPTILATSYVIAGNNSPYVKWINLGFQKGEWKRVWVWAKGGYDHDGQFQYWALDDSDGVIQHVNDDNVSTMYSGGKRERIRINGYGRTTPDCHPTFDDFYVAAGANARARVEIGNAPVYADCTRLAICPTTNWTNTSISAICNVGGLGADSDLYLFVVDSAGGISPGQMVRTAQPTLTVVNGSGSGNYPAGQVVAITANPPSSGKAFAAWMGDFAHIADRTAAQTTVTMPAHDISLIPAYVWIYRLTVNSGSGGGDYPAAAVVAIEADAAPTGQQFAAWAGEAAVLSDAGAASTTVSMPSHAVELTATYSPVAPSQPGDLSGDGFVGQADLDIVLANWGCGGEGGLPLLDPRADASGDGFVGQADLDIVLANWGQGSHD